MSRTPAIDDFAAIRTRMHEIETYPPAGCSCIWTEQDGERLRCHAHDCSVHAADLPAPSADPRWVRLHDLCTIAGIAPGTLLTADMLAEAGFSAEEIAAAPWAPWRAP